MKIFAFMIVSLLGFSSYVEAGVLDVRVASGTVQGVTADGISRFLGIPYAAAPIGNLRWASPQPVRPWKGVRKAAEFGPACIQAIMPDGFGPWTTEYVAQEPTSEDCLSLNIWAPAVHQDKKIPVLVWIHGGAFMAGANSVPVYDGEALARQGIIVVSINYRLGAFGFAAFEELKGAPGGGANFGMQDIVASLRWIHKNIEAFGGNPDRVTIAGQSAGAMAVHQLLMSPQAKGLFSQAIAESGIIDIPIPTIAEAYKRGRDLEKAFEVKDLHELRAVPAENILQHFVQKYQGKGEFYGPVIDDKIVFRNISSSSTGFHNKIPVMIGMVKDEGVIMPDYNTITADQFHEKLKQRFGIDDRGVEELFPAQSDEEAIQSNKALTRSYGLASLLEWSAKRYRNTKRPLHVYYYTHPEPGPNVSKYGAFHSSEIPYIFNTLSMSSERKFGQYDHYVAKNMSEYWANFVKFGNPNGTGLPVWPSFSAQSEAIMELGDNFQRFDTRSEAIQMLRQKIRESLSYSIF